LQLRACTCVALIIVLRVLNLVVPAFYGKMVDALSVVTQDAREKPPIQHAFASVFFPWVAAYLAARFLQGGGACLAIKAPNKAPNISGSRLISRGPHVVFGAISLSWTGTWTLSALCPFLPIRCLFLLGWQCVLSSASSLCVCTRMHSCLQGELETLD
jgi:hypothetical protein